MDRQHVAFRPNGRRDVVEHDEVEARCRIGQIGCHGQLDIRHGAQGLFQQPVALRDQQHLHRLGQQADDGGLVVHGQIVLEASAGR